MSQGQQLPNQWLFFEIGEIADVVAGGTPKASDPENFATPGTQISWITPADLSNYSEKYISKGKRDLSQQGYDSSSAKLMPAGTLLFSSRAPIGYVAIAEGDISTNQGFKNFLLPSGVDSSYAYHYLRSIRDVAESMGTGTTFKEISGANAKKLPFVLAPLAEQKVIADKLDTLLAQVDSTKARLEGIPEILKRFRQSVLAAAVSGQLTEEWRIKNSHLSALEELKALRGTRESILASKNKKDISLKRQESSLPLTSLPTSWSYSYIDPFLDITRRGIKTGPFGSLLKKHEHRDSGVPVIGIENISSGKFIEKSKVFITEEKAEALKDYDILSEDMVISRSGTVGDICVVPSDLGPARFSTNIMRLSFLDKSLSPRFFVMLFLGSPVVLRQIADLCKGSTRLFLNQRIIASINYPIPPKREQTEIVRRVDQLFAYADTVERQVNSALERVNQLTQSILAKAFRGELTAQWREDNADLISGDNSAEALLARIKAERAAQAPKKRTRKKTTP